MIVIQTQHFNINRILLLAVGLWPYQRSKLVQVQTILVCIILTSSVVFQLTTFITTECTPDLVINVFSYAFVCIIQLVKYNAFLLKIQNIRYLLEQLQQIYNELKSEKEIAIIKNYTRNVERYAVIFLVLAFCYIFLINVQSMWPRIFGVFLHINDTRPKRTIPIKTEYFIDQEKHFFIILLHTNVTFCLGTFVVLGIGMMLVEYFRHVCGMFKIASYRIEQAMNIDPSRDIKLKNEIMICREIIYAVDIHRKALRSSKFIVSTFEGMFLLLLMFGIICLSLNLFRIFQIVMSFKNDTHELSLRLATVNAILLYIFLVNYAAQEITDHNNHVFETVYNIEWYVAPLHIQKMILFLLQRGSKSFILSLGGLFVGSLESASTITSASISYFTILYSTQ